MKYVLLLMAACIGVELTKAQSTTVVITAAKDNTMYQEQENSNGAGSNFFAGSTALSNGGALRRGLLYFDLSSIAPGSTVLDATLNLYCNKGRPVTSPVTLHRANAAWGEGSSNAGSDFDGAGVTATPGDATWQQRVFGSSSWTTAGGDFVATASASTAIGAFDQFYSWSANGLKADVQAWVNGPASNYGWVLLGDETVLGTAKRFAAKEATDPGQRPQLSITYTGPVPVTLTQFTTKLSNGGVLLNWQTQQELNNAYFGIEHSTDGVNYTTVGKVNGSGTVSTPKAYQFLHPGVAPGRHFYRLAQTDKDGKVNYSTVVQVVLRKTDASLLISPNPAVGSIQLGDAYAANTLYTISNATGSTVLQGKLQSNSVNIAALSAGTYLIKLQEPGQSPQYGRFVKQ